LESVLRKHPIAITKAYPLSNEKELLSGEVTAGGEGKQGTDYTSQTCPEEDKIRKGHNAS